MATSPEPTTEFSVKCSCGRDLYVTKKALATYCKVCDAPEEPDTPTP